MFIALRLTQKKSLKSKNSLQLPRAIVNGKSKSEGLIPRWYHSSNMVRNDLKLIEKIKDDDLVPAGMELGTLVDSNLTAIEPFEISERLQHEIDALDKQVRAVKDVRNQAQQIHELLTLVNEVQSLDKAARSFGKTVKDLTPIEYAQWRLQEQADFVQNLDLSESVLYSAESGYNNFLEMMDVIEIIYPRKELPSWLYDSLEEISLSYMRRKDNEYVRTFELGDGLLEKFKDNMFPNLLEKGVTPQEFVDYAGGEEVIINPLAVKVSETVLKMMDKDVSVEQRVSLSEELRATVVSYERPSSDDGNNEMENVNQKVASDSISFKIGRMVKDSDFMPQRRLAFDGVTTNSHPLIEDSPTIYVNGVVSNMGSVFEQVAKDEVNHIEWQSVPDFNPPTQFRRLTPQHLSYEPELCKELKLAALNFPMWEGPQAEYAINSAELYIEMKIWKLFNYAHPNLAEDKEMQKFFAETFDISPGEPTLEWALSFPSKEHTFFPEHPLWVDVYEDDEDEEAIIWPEFDSVVIDGASNIAISSVDGLHGTEKYDIRISPSTREEHSEMLFHRAWKKLTPEQRDQLTVEEAYRAISSFNDSEIKKAQAEWGGMSTDEKKAARSEWLQENECGGDQDETVGAKKLSEWIEKL